MLLKVIKGGGSVNKNDIRPRVSLGDYVEIKRPKGAGQSYCAPMLIGQVVYVGKYYFVAERPSGYRESLLHVDLITGYAELLKIKRVA